MSKKPPKGQERKARTPLAHLAIKDAVFSPTRDAAGNLTGGFTFCGQDGAPLEPYAASIRHTYPRASGKLKTVVQAPLGVDENLRAAHDLNRRLTRYEHVFAVDTSSLPDGSLSITAAVYLEDVKLSEGSAGPWSFAATHQTMLEMRKTSQPAERVGWGFVLMLIEKSELAGRIALVVDSDLGAHAALNARQEELLPGLLLPPSVELLYASSDVGTSEYVANAALNICDKLGKRLMAKLRDEPYDSSSYDIRSPFFEAGRLHAPFSLE